MKSDHLSVFIICLLSSFALAAQGHLQLKISGNEDSIVHFTTESMTRQVIHPQPIEALRQENGSYNLDLNYRHPTLISFFIPHTSRPRNLYVYVLPDDSLSIHYDFDQFMPDGDKPLCQFRGTNAAGHTFFYEYSFVPPIDHMPELFQLIGQSSGDNLLSNILGEVQRQHAPLDSLLEHQEIDAAFHQIVSSRIQATLLNGAIGRLFGRKSSLELMNYSYAEKVGIVQQLYNRFPFAGPERLYSLYGEQYATNYYIFQQALRTGASHMFDVPDTLIQWAGQSYSLSHTFSSLAEAEDTELIEYLYAKNLVRYYDIFVDAYRLGLFTDEYSYFKTRFPASPFLEAIESAKDMNRQRDALASNNEVQQIKKARTFEKWWPTIIDGAGRMEDLDLSQKTETDGKDFYVDIWATWCGPCLREMTYNFQADSLLEANGIERLYISIDEQDNKDYWFDHVYDLHLGGYHIMAGEQLKAFLAKLLGFNAETIVIPRYLFIQDGKIVETNAPRPSELNRLAQMIQRLSH